MATEKIQMKMARATEADMDAANRLANLLGEVDKGYYPSAPADDERADEPLWFDADDQEHLRAFYDRVMEHVKAAPGGLFRVTFGFSTLIHNDVCDPALDVLEFHPRILAALAAVETDRAASSPTSDLAVQMYMERHMATRAEAEAFLDKCARPHAIAATDAPVGRNLEGLREQLIAPRGILRNAEGWPVHTGARDPSGWLSHPAIPVCDEGTRVDKLLEAFSIETSFVSMESDAPDFYDKWHEEGLSDCSSWVPTPPSGVGWLILEIYDTEDGPCALFGRDFYVAEKERKDAVRAERRAERIALLDQKAAE